MSGFDKWIDSRRDFYRTRHSGAGVSVAWCICDRWNADRRAHPEDQTMKLATSRRWITFKNNVVVLAVQSIHFITDVLSNFVDPNTGGVPLTKRIAIAPAKAFCAISFCISSTTPGKLELDNVSAKFAMLPVKHVSRKMTLLPAQSEVGDATRIPITTGIFRKMPCLFSLNWNKNGFTIIT